MDYTQILDLNRGYSLGVGGAIVILLVAIWELVWKGLGLWKAARNNENAWFIAILILNTLGILPILYLYVFSKQKSGQ